ncbi:MmgE/PrpD family protein [soil metagenome]
MPDDSRSNHTTDSFATALARRIDGVGLASTPDSIVWRIKAALLNYTLLSVTGYSDADVTWRAVREALSAPGMASVMVTGERRSAGEAAFLNGSLACVRGQNDTHPASFAHPGCVCIPAVLAVAQVRHLSGKQVLEALIAGYETLAYVAHDAADATVARGLRATSVYGPIASAAAVAKLIGLTVDQVATALSLATQFSAGTMQCWAEGSPEWRLQVGHASRAGIDAAHLAEAGMSASAAAFEGKSGFYRAFADNRHSVPSAGFGNGWAIERVQFKPLPGCLINQGPVQSLLELMSAHGLKAGDIDKVDVTFSPQNANYPGTAEYGPFEQATGAVMSAPFMLTAAMRDETLTKDVFDREFGASPIHASSRRVTVESDASFSTWTSRVDLVLKDGRRLDATFDDPSAFEPGWQDTVKLLSRMLGEWQVADAPSRFARLQTLIGAFETAPDVDPLLRLTQTMVVSSVPI